MENYSTQQHGGFVRPRSFRCYSTVQAGVRSTVVVLVQL